MVSISLLACSYAFSAEMVRDFAQSFQYQPSGGERNVPLLPNSLFLAIASLNYEEETSEENLLTRLGGEQVKNEAYRRTSS